MNRESESNNLNVVWNTSRKDIKGWFLKDHSASTGYCKCATSLCRHFAWWSILFSLPERSLPDCCQTAGSDAAFWGRERHFRVGKSMISAWAGQERKGLATSSLKIQVAILALLFLWVMERIGLSIRPTFWIYLINIFIPKHWEKLTILKQHKR